MRGKKAMGFALSESIFLRNPSVGRVMLGDFMVKNAKLGREVCI